MKIDSKSEGSQELAYDWLMNLLLEATADNKKDAADLILRILIRALRTNDLGGKARNLIAEILSNVLESGDSVQAIKPLAPKTAKKRDFWPGLQVYIFVELKRLEGHPFRTSRSKAGAWVLAAEHFGISESKAERLWKDVSEPWRQAAKKTLGGEEAPPEK